MNRETDDAMRRARAMWRYRGDQRPPFAIAPGPGQESVWDYPRPPAVTTDTRRITVHAGSVTIAETTRGLRVLETGSPPTFYLPLDDVDMQHLEPVAGTTFCEWKGHARYWTLMLSGRRLERVAWDYPTPYAEFSRLRGHIAFYPGRLACRVDGEQVQPQAGNFYGGWVTTELVGPFKGEPGTGRW